MTKVSVIIPVYNVEKYLRECLESVVRQTLRDIEIICVDDGSTDGSPDILREFAQNDKRFVIISQSNQGQGVARNKGIENAKGEYIAFVDPDDWIEVDAFEKLYDFSVKNSAEITHFNYKEYLNGNYKYKDLSKKFLKKYKYNVLKNLYYSYKNMGKNFLVDLDISCCTYFIKREFLNKNNVRFAPYRIAEDHLFTVKNVLLAPKIFFINEYFYNYRVREGSSVENLSDENFCVFDIISLLSEFVDGLNDRERLLKEFENYKIALLAKRYTHVPKESRKKYENFCLNLLGEKGYKKMLLRSNGVNNMFEWLFSIKNCREFGKKVKYVTIFGHKRSL